LPIHPLASISWPAFAALASRPLVAIVPLGAIEAHGPHLPLGTDIVIAQAMADAGAERLSARGFEVAVLPPLFAAPAPFAAAFAGTIDAAAPATTMLLQDIARSLGRHGARVTVVANAHHDPAHVAAIRAAVRTIEDEQGPPLVFPDLTRRKWAQRLTDEFQSGACHAGRYETSIVMAAAPQAVAIERMRMLEANPRSLVAAIDRGERTFAEAGGPQAYFGAPADASAAEGREIIERLGEIIADAVMEVLGSHADSQST
jgi:creatinine amidohydrolase